MRIPPAKETGAVVPAPRPTIFFTALVVSAGPNVVGFYFDLNRGRLAAPCVRAGIAGF